MRFWLAVRLGRVLPATSIAQARWEDIFQDDRRVERLVLALQAQMQDGSWAPWEPVGTTQIDHLGEFLAPPKDPEKTLDIQLKMSQLRRPENMRHLL